MGAQQLHTRMGIGEHDRELWSRGAYSKLLDEELAKREKGDREALHRTSNTGLLEIMGVRLSSPRPAQLDWSCSNKTRDNFEPSAKCTFEVNRWRSKLRVGCLQIRKEHQALAKAKALLQARDIKKSASAAGREPGPQDVPLTDEMLSRAVTALKAPRHQVLSELLRLKIAQNDLETLTGLNWLNDNVINFYLTMIVERSKENPKLPKVYAFNTFFVTTLEQKGFPGVRRWTKNVDLFAHDLVLVPVHLGMHWCMAVIDMRHLTIKYYDSMGKRNNRCLRDLLDYLAAEMKDKKKHSMDASEWKLQNVDGLPQQNNGSDCGMFACKYAEYAARDARLNFTQADMPYFRKRMIIELLDRRLMQVP